LHVTFSLMSKKGLGKLKNGIFPNDFNLLQNLDGM
jgi:hypothetical protein